MPHNNVIADGDGDDDNDAAAADKHNHDPRLEKNNTKWKKENYARKKERSTLIDYNTD